MIKTYKVVGLRGGERKMSGTISMDDARIITYTAAPGKKAMMKRLMGLTFRIIDHSSEERGRVYRVPKPSQGPKPLRAPYRSINRQSEPALWFKCLALAQGAGSEKSHSIPTKQMISVKLMSKS